VGCRLPVLLGLSFLLVLGWTTGRADNSSTQAQTEAKLEQLQTEIKSLRKDLERKRSALTDEQEAIKSIDLEIQENALKLRELRSIRLAHDRELAGLQAEQDGYLLSLDKRRQILARQIMTAYRLGRESRLKLVLNQDSPADLSRTLAYYDYFSRSQASQISELKQVLLTLGEMQKKINVELSALDEVQKSQQSVLEEMTSQRDQRQIVIDDLASRIDTEEKQLVELQANSKDLQSLLEKLSDVLADIPANLGKHNSPGELKGKMQTPVNGRVRHAFGQARTAGLHWQGWLIAADRGTLVKSIANGRVAYSDWLRGYGLLMIIDHGDGIMSLYGNNESMFQEVGDWVESGSNISTVGSSPLNGDGIYFEIRKDGKAVDPAVWIKR
jgi:septal ring factor EnvC (AmiA/AmiB activator)